MRDVDVFVSMHGGDTINGLHMRPGRAVVELDGDRARSRCYFNAPMGRVGDDGAQLVITNAGYYADDLVRTEAGWRITQRHCEQTLMIGQLPDGYVIPE